MKVSLFKILLYSFVYDLVTVVGFTPKEKKLTFAKNVT